MQVSELNCRPLNWYDGRLHISAFAVTLVRPSGIASDHPYPSNKEPPSRGDRIAGPAIPRADQMANQEYLLLWRRFSGLLTGHESHSAWDLEVDSRNFVRSFETLSLRQHDQTWWRTSWFMDQCSEQFRDRKGSWIPFTGMNFIYCGLPIHWSTGVCCIYSSFRVCVSIIRPEAVILQPHCSE